MNITASHQLVHPSPDLQYYAPYLHVYLYKYVVSNIGIDSFHIHINSITQLP